MQNLKKTRLILLIAFLSACNLIKPKVVQNCRREIVFLPASGEGRVIDEENSFCACRDYKFSKEYIGPVGNEVLLDIDSGMCRSIVGYPIDSYGEMIAWLKDVQDSINKFTDR